MARKPVHRKRGSARAIDHTDKPELFVQFETGYKAGIRITDLCKRLHIKPKTAETWARNIRVEIGAALRAIGINEISQAQKLLKLQRARMPKWNPAEERFQSFEDGATQLAATREISRLLDHYPAPKEDQPAVSPVTLIFSTANLILPGEEPDYHNTKRLLDVTQAPKVGPQDRTAAEGVDEATDS
jgi:hypothetical protein